MAELRRRMSLAELRRWAEFYRWEVESQRAAAAEAHENAALDAQVAAQLAAYRR